jgi:hypothetical protein
MDHVDDRMKQASYEGARSTVVALSGVLSALVAVLTFIIIPMPQPIGGFDASSILVLSLPIILGAELGTIIVCVGESVGTMFLIAAGVGLPYYLPGIVAVRGVEAYLVGRIARSGLFGRSGENTRLIVATTIGPVWETAGFIAANFYLYYLFYGLAFAIGASIALLSTLIDWLWVPFAMIVITAVKSAFGTSYLDKQMGLRDDNTRKGLFYSSALFILICWVLLFLVPFAFTNWFTG